LNDRFRRVEREEVETYVSSSGTQTIEDNDDNDNGDSGDSGNSGSPGGGFIIPEEITINVNLKITEE
jgi:hypothetical protein